MTLREMIQRRILLKEQLIVLVRREIQSLEKELGDLDSDLKCEGSDRAPGAQVCGGLS